MTAGQRDGGAAGRLVNKRELGWCAVAVPLPRCPAVIF
jgi:hypothetical protein